MSESKETDMTRANDITQDRLAYSIAEVSQLTGIGRTTLYRLMDQGDLQTRKLGRRRLIPASELLRMLAVNEPASE